MTIRTRMALWFTLILAGSLIAMGMLAYHELVVEPHSKVERKAEREIENPQSEVLEALAWCGIPSLVLGLSGGWWLMRRAMAPVAVLTQAAENLNEHNLNTRLPRSGNGDEMDRLTEVFNQMTGRLDHAFARIREFTLHASHELKTPLTILHNEMETALQGEALAPETQARLESQLDEVQRLTRIVDALTLLTKAEVGHVKLERQPVRLDEVLREAHGDAESLARPFGVKVHLDDCPPVTVCGDRHRLRQLVLNLSDNAIKYNQHGGTARLGLICQYGHAVLHISNTGPGISPEALAQICDPFFREESRHPQRVEGCGLGLSIVRWIVHAHSGTLEISSEPNKETLARVRLPISETKNNVAN